MVLLRFFLTILGLYVPLCMPIPLLKLLEYGERLRPPRLAYANPALCPPQPDLHTLPLNLAILLALASTFASAFGFFLISHDYSP